LQLNPRQLEAFRMVMLRGSVTAAAQDLNVSQPAVSRLVRDLETRSGLTLFVRHGNHLVPTPEAGLLLAEVERYASGLQAISTFAAELRHRRRGTLRIIAMPAMSMGFLPRFLASFIAGRSLASVYLHGMPSHLIVEAVLSGQAEIGFAASPPERPGLRVEPLESRVVLVVPRAHRLAGRRIARREDLAGERFITVVGPPNFLARSAEILAEVGDETGITTPLTGIACSLVAEGAGIALVDPYSAADFADHGIVAIPFEPAIDFRVAILTSTHRRLSAVAQEFIEEFRAHAESVAARFGARTSERRAPGRRGRSNRGAGRLPAAG
jgi:DNA-binding transcriptional LysR family regulator